LKLKIRVAGFILGKSINESFEEEFKEGTSLGDMFKALNKEKRVGKGFFAGLMTKPGSISVLLNGDRVVFPQDEQIKLKDGDEIAVLSPIAGG